jgi:nitric oxide reductase subunit B
LLVGLLCLLGGAVFGCIAALQFIYPDFAHALPFFKNRPLHVSLILAWIFLTAMGGVLYYLPTVSKGPWSARAMQKVQLALLVLTGTAILTAYVFGIFGGREYWEYPPILSIGIAIAWTIFAVNVFLAISSLRERWPAYVWMWATGVVFFAFTFTEANLWLIPAIRNDPIRDITVQWKAYGSLIGSWNMLVYGTGLYVMERISGNEQLSRSRTAFALYVLGFLNLLFGWAHHIYVVPISPLIRNLAYVISMSEWLLFFRIIWNWRGTVSTARRFASLTAYRFMLASDVWIFVNILIALLISIPAINVITHGTHVTVAHAMGTTIGINTMILLSSVYYIAGQCGAPRIAERVTAWGIWVLNVALGVFILMLLASGISKGTAVSAGASFAQAAATTVPFMTVFAFSGIAVLAGLCMVAIPVALALARTLRPANEGS